MGDGGWVDACGWTGCWMNGLWWFDFFFKLKNGYLLLGLDSWLGRWITGVGWVHGDGGLLGGWGMVGRWMLVFWNGWVVRLMDV